jgi:hypothetical protein
MSQRVKAVYHKGAFVPQLPFSLPEDTEVELTIDDPFTVPPEITDPEQRTRFIEEIVRSMQSNPIPVNAPRFTREELHERR